jgi:hypothetical protein
LLNLLGQEIDIPARSEREETKSIGILADDIQRVRADRACGSKYGERTGGHERATMFILLSGTPHKGNTLRALFLFAHNGTITCALARSYHAYF